LIGCEHAIAPEEEELLVDAALLVLDRDDVVDVVVPGA